jgi:hypothetical protein
VGDADGRGGGGSDRGFAGKDRRPIRRRRLVVLTANAEPIRAEFATAFSQWHREKFGRPVFVEYRIYGGASDIARYFESARETLYKSLGTYQVDIVWGGGRPVRARLSAPGHLAAFDWARSCRRRSRRRRSATCRCTTEERSAAVVRHGAEQLRHRLQPRRRRASRPSGAEDLGDLRDPQYRGWIVLADPMRSGVARTAFMVIVERAMQDAVERPQRGSKAGPRHGADPPDRRQRAEFHDSGTVSRASSARAMRRRDGDRLPGAVTGRRIAGGERRRARLHRTRRRDGDQPGPDRAVQRRGASRDRVRFIEFCSASRASDLEHARRRDPADREDVAPPTAVMKSVYDDRGLHDAVNPYAAADFNTRGRARRHSRSSASSSR